MLNVKNKANVFGRVFHHTFRNRLKWAPNVNKLCTFLTLTQPPPGSVISVWTVVESPNKIGQFYRTHDAPTERRKTRNPPPLPRKKGVGGGKTCVHRSQNNNSKTLGINATPLYRPGHQARPNPPGLPTVPTWTQDRGHTARPANVQSSRARFTGR